MSKKEQVLMFNNIFENLLEQLAPYIGSNYSFQFKQLTRFNQIMPIQKFSENCLQYKIQIFDKNPQYFLEKDYSQDTNDYLNEIMNLKNIYTKLDSISRDNLWEILQALTLLSEQYSL